MSHCKFADLTDRTVIRITGADAETFLQGLITNDVQDVASMVSSGDSIKTCFAGLLTPQGKILFDFIVVKQGDIFYLDAPTSSADDLVKRLTFYKLRADVALENLKDSHKVWAIWGADNTSTSSSIAIPDPRLDALGLRCISEGSPDLGADCKQSNDTDYHAHRISLGVPEGGRDYAYGDTFPHDVCYDFLSGVDFRKGCYVGQEVVSRMLHRGTMRTRVVLVSSQSDLPREAKTELLVDGKPVGQIGIPHGNQAIALVRLDRATRALVNDVAIMAADIPVSLAVPDWADYELPTRKEE